MLTLKNIRPYTPENAEILPAIVWLESEDGLDWYFHRTRFQPDTVKICYDADGRILSVTRDVTQLFPAGMSVTELAEVPAELDTSGRWRWDGKKIIPPPAQPEVGRTADEILAELDRLRDELEVLRR